MGVMVDFGIDLDAMLDELQETYDGRILSPQGKIVRVMSEPVRKQEDGTWVFLGHVYVTVMMGEEIYEARMETIPVLGHPVLDEKWREAQEALERLAAEVEAKIAERGFIIRRGRYVFRGDEPAAVEPRA